MSPSENEFIGEGRLVVAPGARALERPNKEKKEYE